MSGTAPGGRPLKMKDLEERTKVGREAIHFYLREGLLPEPERPKRNVAHYSEEHVLRIRLIKRLQEERFLPLSRIKELLDQAEISSDGGNDLTTFELTLLSLLNGDAPRTDLKVADAAARSGLSVARINELGRRGVIRIRRAGRERLLDFRDAAIVALWGRLLALGFRDRPGYDAGYLERYAAIVDELAEAEIEQFLEAFGEDLSPETAAMATRGIDVANEILGRLRIQALLRHLAGRAGSAQS